MKLQKKKMIFVDVDGTICDNEQLPNFDDQPMDYTKATPIPDRINHINELYDEGHHITYWTARGCRSGLDHRQLTIDQLRDWGCKYHDLQVGNKPHFDMYICDKSWNSESFFHYRERRLP